ncbi:MAG TPA: type II toxin-antitoxin system VapC family toxin [Vicinamibacterales bacterium]|nr:type II toxin-antitoxin system VapC family toxin [Vicinamibacterales bacterium]
MGSCRRTARRSIPFTPSAWEIATKFRLGRLPGAADVAADTAAAVSGQGFVALEITIGHAQRAGGLAGAHQDPFDRMLIAQSQMEDLPLVSNEEVFDAYGVTRLW